MLSSFLTQLQGYFTKYFVVGALLPVLACGVLNGAVAYFVFPALDAWIDANVLKAGLGEGAFVSTSLVAAAALLAYVLNGLATTLRQILEGRRWSGWAGQFVYRETRLRNDLAQRVENAARRSADLNEAGAWRAKLDAAYRNGRRDHPNAPFQPPPDDPTPRRLAALDGMKANFDPIPPDDLERLVDRLAGDLATHNGDRGDVLLDRKERLQLLIDYAQPRAQADYARLKNELDANFGDQAIAPTRMGNVAYTIQSYALRRYGCNLELVWSNLLRVAQNDEKMQATLLEAKTGLDFLIACCWLTLFSSCLWTIVFRGVAPSRPGFLAAALGGPFAAWLWYRAATEQYRAFADVAMTTFDMLRFDLLKALRIAAPADVEDERDVWTGVTVLKTWDEGINFRYDSPKS